MKNLKIIIAALMILFIGFGSIAQDFISVATLSKNLTNTNYIIIDSRKASEYNTSHIKGAINIPIESLSSKSPIEGILKSSTELAKIFGQNGVSQTKTIICYCNKGNNAGRMYWILKYLGVPKVKLLDGNIGAWKAGRKPVTRNPSKLKPTTFTAKVNKSLKVSISDVEAAQKNSSTIIVDVRKPDYFNGTNAKSKGHIPGAINLDSEKVKNSKGLIKSTEELNKLFKAKGMTKDKTIILYCQTSTRAGLVYTVLTSKLGYTKVKVYDGAYNEWVAKGKPIKK